MSFFDDRYPLWADAQDYPQWDRSNFDRYLPYRPLSDPFDQSVSGLPDIAGVTISDNLPDAVESRGIVGSPIHAFVHDYYYRIHVIPAILDLGNLLSEQTRTYELWNAHFTPKYLSSTVEEGTQGITVTEPIAPPTTFSQLESREYSVTIDVDGPPVINGSITYNFPGETPQVIITGRRVVAWTFIPQYPAKETLEWKTNVLTTRQKEQRFLLRRIPRQTFRYTHQFDERELATARNISGEWASRVYGVPVWNETDLIGGIAGNPNQVFTDTDSADYRVGGSAFIWESFDKNEIVEIYVIDPGYLTTKLPIVGTYTNAYIMPLRFGRAVKGIQFERNAHRVSKGTAEFLITDSVDLEDATGYPSMESLPVFNEKCISGGGQSESVISGGHLYDNDVGGIQYDDRDPIAHDIRHFGLHPLTLPDLWKIRQFLHYLRGQWRPFWLPTWLKDLVVTESIGSGSGSMTVINTHANLYRTNLAVGFLMRLNDGTEYYRKIAGFVADNDVTKEIVHFEPSLGATIDVNDIEICCLMEKVRLAGDALEMSHNDARASYMSIPFRLVNDE